MYISEHTGFVIVTLTCSFCHRAVVEVCVSEESCNFAVNYTKKQKKTEHVPKAIDGVRLISSVFPFGIIPVVENSMISDLFILNLKTCSTYSSGP